MPSPSATLMKALLINGATDMFPGPGLITDRRSLAGFGRVSVRSSVLSIITSAATSYNGLVDIRKDSAKALVQSQFWTQSITVPAWAEVSPGGDKYGQTLKVTLVWTDRVNDTLVNGLGLAVTAHDGTSRLGNKDGDMRQKLKPQDYDNINNVQQIKWNNCPPGDMTLTVQCLKTALNTTSVEKVGFAVVWSLE